MRVIDDGPAVRTVKSSKWRSLFHRRSSDRAGSVEADRSDAPRTAFVLAGGGARGAAQVGMLAALIDHGLRADAVYGVSVGALNAAAYASDPTLQGIERLAGVWAGLQAADVFPRARFAGPWRFLQQRDAVHGNEGIRKLIEDGLEFTNLEDTEIHFEVIATSLNDGRPRWFDRGSAAEAILASAALPALLPPVEIGGELFIDGGVVDNVPVDRAVANGARRIFVLLCGPLHYTPRRYRRPVEAVLTAFFIAIHASFARSLDSLQPGVELIVFTVDTLPVSSYDDFSETEELFVAGYANASAVIDFWEKGGIGEIRESVFATDGADGSQPNAEVPAFLRRAEIVGDESERASST